MKNVAGKVEKKSKQPKTYTVTFSSADDVYNEKQVITSICESLYATSHPKACVEDVSVSDSSSIVSEYVHTSKTVSVSEPKFASEKSNERSSIA